MIHEYFIEPGLIYRWANDPKDARFFLKEIGLGKPRLLSTFPRGKPNKLRGDLLREMPENLPEIAKKRVEEFCQIITEAAVKRKAINDPTGDWVSDALSICSEYPPDVVMSVVAQDDQRNWISPEDAFEEGSIFQHQDQIIVSRTAEHMASAVKNLLRFSQTIVIADPYIHTPGGIESLNRFISVACENRLNSTLPIFQILFSKRRDSPSPGHVLNQINNESGVPIQIYEVEEKPGGEKFHNRYILSELGGIYFGVGTDAGDPAHTDEITLMNGFVYRQRWQQYKDAQAFNITDQATR